jgi:hypothetical protein
MLLALSPPRHFASPTADAELVDSAGTGIHGATQLALSASARIIFTKIRNS